MIGMVLVTHGRLAEELRSAMEHVVGTQKNVDTVCIGPDDDIENRRAEIEACICRCDVGDGVVLLTDMFGGTPTNISAMFLKEGEVEIVTGVNLPMVIKLASFNREATLHELASEVEDQGKEAICRASMLLEPQKMRKDA